MSLGGEAPANLKVGYLDISNLYLTESDQDSTTNETTIDVMGGYGYNVLTALSSYTNWTYTFVGGSWQEQFDSLTDGSIDILLPIAYTESRAASFYFAKGINIYDDLTALYTLSSSKGLYFNDLASVKSIKTFGAIKGCYDTMSFISFAEKNSLDVTGKIKYFDNLEAMQNALRKGEVDAIASGNLYSQDFQMIYSISSYPCYIAAHDESIALKADAALQKLSADKPDFFAKAHNSYFGRSNSRKAYTAEESLFMDSMKGKSLSIVGNNSFAPFESYDESTSKYVGVYPDVLDLVGQETGLSFTYKETDSLTSSWETAKNGGSDLISGVYVDGAVTRDYNTLPTTSFYSYQSSLIVKTGFSLSTSSSLHIAIKKGFLGSISYLKSYFPKWTITQYDTEDEGMAALLGDEVDSMLISNVALNKLKLLNGHADLSALQGFSISIPLCFGVYSGNDTSDVLQGLISKAIDNIPSESISECFVKNAVGSGEPLTPQEMFMANLPLYVSLIVVGAVLLIAFAAFLAFFITERRSRKKLTAKNEELQRALQLAESYEKSQEEADKFLESAQCGIIQISCSLDLKDMENMHLVFSNDYAIPLTGFDLRSNSDFQSFYKSIGNPFCGGVFDLIQKARSRQVGASVEGSFLAYDEKKTLDALAKVIAVFPKANEKIIQVTLFDVSERSEIEKKLLVLSEADSLTGLLNKKTVEEH